jgi:predicted nucleic acid-binding protein
MDPAFWDSSSLVPICIAQHPATPIRKLISRHDVVVWWCTPVEIRSAFARLVRTGELTAAEHATAQKHLELLRLSWREIEPTKELRARAESLLDRFPLKSADALQLAAALTWCGDRPQGRPFISGDKQLLSAASQLGFHPIAA